MTWTDARAVHMDMTNVCDISWLILSDHERQTWVMGDPTDIQVTYQKLNMTTLSLKLEYVRYAMIPVKTTCWQLKARQVLSDTWLQFSN